MASSSADNHSSAHLQLHYTTPADTWSSALPLGNGRLGCMLHGGTEKELLSLNEDSVWYGGPRKRTPLGAAQHLPQLRQLIRSELHTEAEQLARDAFFSSPVSMGHFEPLGTCTFDFGHPKEAVSSYRRWLDLDQAIAGVSYNIDELHVEREMFASYPDSVLVMKITASSPISFVVKLTRLSEHELDFNEYLDSVRSQADDSHETGRIIMHATPGGYNSNRLCCVLGAQVPTGNGSIETISGGLRIISTSCLLIIGAHTTFRFNDPESAALANVDQAVNRSWDTLRLRHVKDYTALFDRLALRMWPDASHIPTDIRIASRDANDVGLVSLYHNYGRYLLISSSRDSEKSLPANLQGIWNPNFSPPWGSKYTININIQMNYWPVAASNLVECVLPLVGLIEKMAIRGVETARIVYDCSGWCSHHNTDIWGDTDPQDAWMPATLWPLSGVWLCVDVLQVLQYHYNYDLHRRVFPLLQGCIEFLLDFLIPSTDGRYMLSNPSLSPENTFVSEAGQLGIFCEGSAMDISIIRSAFESFIWSTEKLQIFDDTLIFNVKTTVSKLPELQVNKDGRIQEWGLKDYVEHEPGHRHISHLYSLYPGNRINPWTSPRLAEAAKRVLERRASYGGGHTGWSRAWLLNMHARLLDPEGCGNHMELLLRKSTLPNLLDTHPPFQIDGNFGGCAGILECLVQSFESLIHKDHSEILIRLLPSCPPVWANGSLRGVCLRGGFQVSFNWSGGQINDPLILKASSVERIRARVLYPDGKELLVEGAGEHHLSRNADTESDK